MKKVLVLALMLTFVATFGYADDPTWIATNSILNRCFDSDTNSLKSTVTGDADLGDVSCDDLTVSGNTYLGVGDTAKNVGIGTQSPTVSLDVVGVISADVGIGIAQDHWTGTRLSLPLENDAGTPTLAIGANNTGIYASAADGLNVAVGGVGKFVWTGNFYQGIASNSGCILNETATSTNPSLAPRGSADANTGIGSAGVDIGNLIANATSVMSWDSSGVNVQTGKHVISSIKSGTTQANAGAGVGELYHCISSDSIKIGV